MTEEDIKDGAAASAPPASTSGVNEYPTNPANHEVEIDDTPSRSRVSSIGAENDEEKMDKEAQQLQRQSTELGPAIAVPRMKRRGVFGQLTLVAEVEDPKTYPRKMKWFITFIVAVAAAAAPMGSSIFFREWISSHIRGM